MAIVQDEISLVKVSNGNDGKDTYIHKAYSWSADGTDRFTDKYPNENLLLNSKGDNISGYSQWGGSKLTIDSEGIVSTANIQTKGPYGVLTPSVELVKGTVYSLQAMLGSYYSTNVFDYIFLIGVNGGSQLLPHISIEAYDTTLRNYNISFTPNNTGDYYILFAVDTRNSINSDSTGFRIREIKIEKSSEPTIYTPSPKDDYENAYPKYEGYYSSHNPVQSTNPSDYTWSVIRGENGKDGTNGADGKDGVTPKDVISGYLSNDSIIVPATPTGTVTDYSKAFGDFIVFEGQTQKTSGVTYSKVSEVGMTSSINNNGRYAVSALSADMGTATYRATYSGVTIDKIMIVVKNKQGPSGTNGADGKDGSQGPQGVPGKDGSNGKDGATGPQGPPTGITTSASVPSSPYVNMLWQNTGTNNGYLTGTVYQWNGQKWNIFIFTAENIATTTLSAISAYLGDVEGGSFTGGKFINNFVDIPLLYDSTRKATGQTKIENGVMTITGKIDGTYDFVTKYTVDAISSTIYYPNSAAVMKAFSITPDGFLLADHQNGFSGQLLASALTKTPWVDIPMRSGYSGASHNMPKYKITHNLDGTRTISFRGQIVKLAASGSGVIDMEAGTDHSFADLPVNVRPNVEANGYGVTSSGNGCRVWTYTKGGMGCRIGITKTNYVDLSNLSYIID